MRGPSSWTSRRRPQHRLPLVPAPSRPARRGDPARPPRRPALRPRPAAGARPARRRGRGARAREPLPRPQGRRAISTATCFSLYATKNVAAGEGGLIATNDDDARRAHPRDAADPPRRRLALRPRRARVQGEPLRRARGDRARPARQARAPHGRPRAPVRALRRGAGGARRDHRARRDPRTRTRTTSTSSGSTPSVRAARATSIARRSTRRHRDQRPLPAGAPADLVPASATPTSRRCPWQSGPAPKCCCRSRRRIPRTTSSTRWPPSAACTRGSPDEAHHAVVGTIALTRLRPSPTSSGRSTSTRRSTSWSTPTRGGSRSRSRSWSAPRSWRCAGNGCSAAQRVTDTDSLADAVVLRLLHRGPDPAHVDRRRRRAHRRVVSAASGPDGRHDGDRPARARPRRRATVILGAIGLRARDRSLRHRRLPLARGSLRRGTVRPDLPLLRALGAAAARAGCGRYSPAADRAAAARVLRRRAPLPGPHAACCSASSSSRPPIQAVRILSIWATAKAVGIDLEPAPLLRDGPSSSSSCSSRSR